MSEIDRLVDELQREHSGDPWHGSPVKTILRDVTAAEAASRSVPGAHTIWELVLHMTAWKNEVRRRLGGAPAGDPQDGDWPEVGATTPERWDAALSSLDAAHQALIAAVGILPESALFAPTVDPRNRPLGAGVPHYTLLHGLAQHDAYHAGQIAMLVRAARAR